MAAEPLRYTSQQDAQQAAARLNAKDPGSHIVEQQAETDSKTVWYVKELPPLCPVRGIDLSTIPVEQWRSDIASKKERAKRFLSYTKPFFWSSVPFFALAGILYLNKYPMACQVLMVFATIVLGSGLVTDVYGTVLQYPLQKHRYFKCGCGRQIGTDVDWICGECHHKNERAGTWNSFLTECQHCGNAPAAFVCYHCGRVIPLIAGGDFRHPAYASDGRGENEKTDRHEERVAEAERRKQLFEKEIEALEAETKVVLTAKELEDVRNELCDASSTEFERQMKDSASSFGTIWIKPIFSTCPWAVRGR